MGAECFAVNNVASGSPGSTISCPGFPKFIVDIDSGHKTFLGNVTYPKWNLGYQPVLSGDANRYPLIPH